MNNWQLPSVAQIAGCPYNLHTDFRDILEIFAYLQDTTLPEFVRWHVAVALFYEQPVPEQHMEQAIEYLCRFINGGKEELGRRGPRLLDWQQDADLIAADINRSLGQDIRAMEYVHWWTFLSWFHGIGQGQLGTVVSIRDKLSRGKKLEDWEREYYRNNKARVDLRSALNPEEQAEKEALNAMLQDRPQDSADRLQERRTLWKN